MKNDSNMQELYVMMFALQTLHNRGITIRETVAESLENLLRWYRQSGNRNYLELALLHMQAYVNMGFILDDRAENVQEILNLTGKTKGDFEPYGYSMGKRVRINKTQIRGMIGKWKPSAENPMAISEVVNDIMDKVSNHREGRYIYQYRRKNLKDQEPEVYELVINKDESYFYDVKNFRFYTFVEE